MTKNGNHITEFTVNIALIENREPYAGFVYVPVKDVLYFGVKDYGSFKLSNASMQCDSQLLGKTVKIVSSPAVQDEIKVVASRSLMSLETEKFIQELKNRFEKVTIVSSGSSIKLCMVADGSAHVYPRFAPTMEWDTAAAHAVCKYAGVEVMDYKTNKELKYNKENLLNNWFLVSDLYRCCRISCWKYRGYIIAEIASTRTTERGGRADDKRSEAAMEDRKKLGYF